MLATEVIKRPLLTEKSAFSQNELNKYAFVVDTRATKDDIKKAIEELYKVSVTKVNTSVHRASTRRLKYGVVFGKFSKKAIISVKEGQRIELF
jgi:large subunit ribosomal protein L23